MERLRTPLGDLFYYNRRLLVAVLLSAMLALTLAGALSRSRNTQYEATNFASLGSIQEMGVQIYGGNLTATSNQTNQYLNWGIIYPGSQINRSFYMKSLSYSNITLTLEVTNWTPLGMSRFMNLTWNYNGMAISLGQTIFVTLTLLVSNSNTFTNYLITNNFQNFTFDMNITPVEE